MTEQEIESKSEPDVIEKGTAVLAAGIIGLATFVTIIEVIWKLWFHY